MPSLPNLVNRAGRAILSLRRRGLYSLASAFTGMFDPYYVVRNNFIEKRELADAFKAFDDKDYSKAFELFKYSAEQGDSAAQNNIGVLYETGTVVPRSDRSAGQWYRKAAEQGLAAAQYNLAAILVADLMAERVSYDLEGTEKRYIEAYVWVTLAAAQDHPDAANAAKRMGQHMTPAQIAKAEKLAGDWKPKNE